MKFYIAIIFSLFLSAASGQSSKNGEFNLAQLPARVTSQWAFHGGDNPAWADTAFDSRGWQHLDLTQSQHFLPQVTTARVAWFRLTLNVAPALRGKAVSLIINQFGGAEVYFNGMLIRSTGKVAAGNDQGEARYSLDEPLTLQLTSAPKQYIAIRYSHSHSNLVIGYGLRVVRATFYQVDSGWDRFFERVTFYTTRAFVSGCFMLLAILQLAIYWFNRERKVNLYLSLYAFMQFVTLVDGLWSPVFQGTNAYTAMLMVFNVAAVLDFIFLIMMTLAFFGYPKGRWFWILASLGLPVMVIQFIGNNAENERVLAIYNMFCYVVLIVISLKALRQKKEGAALFLAGIITAAVFFMLFNIDAFVSLQSILVISFEIAFAFLPPAIILSILLAREFAHNLISLRQKLAEVESLSAKSLQQELEKQQILSTQNELLEQTVNNRTAELHQSLNELKTTQTQLIQSEKMASLGELTAGIAHEIQNPLNFVNNFSEVNKEMLEELKAESTKPKADRDEQLESELINDLIENEKKINHHGKRADSIVKGMLQHSRTSTGEKQPTDLNALADEFLKLSYHGLRAKDKSFNADMVTGFDKNLPKVNIVQQDIGRVLLNLFNNAFYAVNQKQKTADENYKPEVTVLTSVEKNNLVIKVEDNGNGIPDAIKDKIMQPFFTTKPTGEGTGLGLSLSYDIVVKGHGGSIQVNSAEGEGSEFIIAIPIS